MADSSTPTITEFLLARIAEDEAAAIAATDSSGVWDAFEVNHDLTQEFATGVELIERMDADDNTDGLLLAECDRFPGEFDDNGEVSLMGDTGLTWFAHMARWDPVRVLAECKAKRDIIGPWADGDGPLILKNWTDHPDITWPQEIINMVRCLHALAVVYADHSDYQTEWAA